MSRKVRFETPPRQDRLGPHQTIRKSKMKVCMGTTAQVMAIIKTARAAPKDAGFTVDYSEEAGTVIIKVRGETIYWAIEKGAGQPWIVRYNPDYFEGVGGGVP